MISKNIKSKIRNNIFYPYDKEQYKKDLNTLIEAAYSNQLIFLKITFKEKDIIKFKEEVRKAYTDSIENSLICISFLNFVYGRYIENKKKKSIKFVMLIAFHSILGYDKNMESSLISCFLNYKITHLDTLSKIKKCMKYISGNYDYSNIYYYHYGAMLYGADDTRIIELFEESKFQPNRFKRLDFFSRYSDEKSVFRYLSTKIYSVREKSPLSIINLWNVYMLANNLRYNPEHNNIYKKISKEKYEYFSELDYLTKNIKRIWINTIYRFKYYKYFPITKLISDHLQSSIQLINTDGTASMLLPMIDSEFNKIEIEESINSDNSFHNTDRCNKAFEEYKVHVAYLEEKYKEEISFGNEHMTKQNLFLNDEEFKRKVEMDIFLENTSYVHYD